MNQTWYWTWSSLETIILLSLFPLLPFMTIMTVTSRGNNKKNSFLEITSGCVLKGSCERKKCEENKDWGRNNWCDYRLSLVHLNSILFYDFLKLLSRHTFHNEIFIYNSELPNFLRKKKKIESPYKIQHNLTFLRKNVHSKHVFCGIWSGRMIKICVHNVESTHNSHSSRFLPQA